MSTPTEPTAESAKLSKRKWTGLALLSLLVIVAVASYFLWPADSDGQRDAAVAACRAGNFTDAEPKLKEALARHPNDVEVLQCLAKGYFAAEQYADAEPYFSKLIELRPQTTAYLRDRMTVYRRLKQDEKAYGDAKQLLDLDTSDRDVRRLAVNLAFSVGQFADAEESCQTLLRDEPNDRRLRIMLSNIRRARGDDKGAGEILDELIREDSNDYGALLARGILYDETGHTDQAIPLLRRVFENDRTRRRTSGYQLGMALAKVGQQEEADRVLSEVRRLQDVELFSEAIKSQPDNPELMVRLAERLIREGNAEDGVKMLESAVERYPHYAPAHLALATQYEKMGQGERAAKHRRLAGKGS